MWGTLITINPDSYWYYLMYASRMTNLPPYLFARIDEMKAEQQKKGVDIIDLGVGDPDLPTPDHIVTSLCEAAKNPENHHYPSYVGMPAYRGAVADWYENRFGVSLDPGKEVVALMGSKDGIAHIAEAFVNPGDYVLAPSPGIRYTARAPSLPRELCMRCHLPGRMDLSRCWMIFQKKS